MATKKVESPTGKPSKKRDEIKDFEKGKVSGGKRASAYSAPAKPKAKPAKPAAAKPTPSMLGSGAAAGAGKALKSRGKQIDAALKKSGA